MMRRRMICYLAIGVVALSAPLPIRAADSGAIAACKLARYFEQSGDLPSAIQAYNEALRRDPNHLVAYLDRGRIHLSQQRYAQAIADFTEAIAHDPSYIDAFLERSEAYLQSGDRERAEADFERATFLEEASRPAPKSPEPATSKPAPSPTVAPRKTTAAPPHEPRVDASHPAETVASEKPSSRKRANDSSSTTAEHEAILAPHRPAPDTYSGKFQPLTQPVHETPRPDAAVSSAPAQQPDSTKTVSRLFIASSTEATDQSTTALPVERPSTGVVSHDRQAPAPVSQSFAAAPSTVQERAPVEPARIQPTQAMPKRIAPMQQQAAPAEPIRPAPAPEIVKIGPAPLERSPVDRVAVEPAPLEPRRAEPARAEPVRSTPVASKREPQSAPTVATTLAREATDSSAAPIRFTTPSTAEKSPPTAETSQPKAAASPLATRPSQLAPAQPPVVEKPRPAVGSFAREASPSKPASAPLVNPAAQPASS
ncbi:MAG TPA: tetratricopeptide repeat protein, partial [Pirellulales bacterium]|nr:tetratricopeptide repeat protein [Pirellulales bacterium]